MAKDMRKVRIASVVRTRMDQTAVVEMVWKQRHPVYQKQMRRVARFYVHDPKRQCQVGDVVRIQETRPISKTKHWRLLEILERHQVAEVRPIELEQDVEPVITGEALLQTPPSEEDALAIENGDTEEDSAAEEEDAQA
jgi:small subunit ribosomal protein S17